MGSQPQSQDVEHQASPEVDDLRIRREAVRERSHGQPRREPQHREHSSQMETMAQPPGSTTVG
jgi:hypothetical protein